MATLVLTAVGTALAGPIGGAIGALAGQAIDARLFAPKARHGPRLGELAVQTSSYGTAIPKIFGTMRVAGTVIWSTDLQETRAREGGGKGRPQSVSYNYSASFAVALSGRSIQSVRRIWADGKLLRGAAGDFKSETKYRLYDGGEDQEADPLIASAEGAGRTPAFRGIAYAMFEDFQLADYGNRIPSLTFEVEADAAPVAIGTVAEALSAGLIAPAPTPFLSGYAASGDSVRGVLESLASVFPLSLGEREGGLRLGLIGGDPLSVPANATGVYLRDPATGRTELARQVDGVREVAITYHDVERDFQIGIQRAVRPGPAGSVERVALAAVLSAGQAKALAEGRLLRLEAEQAGATVHLSFRHAEIRPGGMVRLGGIGGTWRVVRATLDGMRVRLELLRFASEPTAAVVASSGRPVSQVDQRIGPTNLRLLDLPIYGEQPAGQPQLIVVAAGVEPGWRRATLSISLDGGASWQQAGGTAAPATIGRAVDVLADGEPALIDERSAVEVELLNSEMSLESRTDAALAGDANLACLGAELIQFGRAEQVGPRRFRLTRLLRGRFGTEWACADHRLGEAFVLIEAESSRVIDVPVARQGSDVRILANGLGDDAAGVEAGLVLSGEVVRPPAPVHLRVLRDGAGTLRLSWVRRSRAGWRWIDGADAPLAEEVERYRLHLSDGAGRGRTIELAEASFVYDAAMQASDGAAGPIAAEIVQLGMLASSRAARVVG